MATMVCVSNEQENDPAAVPADSSASAKGGLDAPWSRARRLSVAMPIAVILVAILVFVSHATAVTWNNEPSGQTVDTLTSDTDVTFAGEDASTPTRDTYKVDKKVTRMTVTRSSTGETESVRVLVRSPRGASGRRPAIVFMHGAGYGTIDDSYGDVASILASAGFVTAVMDKPVWSTDDITRDYPASAAAYDKVIEYLRTLDNVNPDNVGIYANSESTWIASYLLGIDHRVAFQVLLSPMVSTPRRSIGFLASQNFTLAGANRGYQSVVRRVLRVDGELFGLTNFDLNTMNTRAYSIPTLVVYGSKDVMTAQVSGVHNILRLSHKAGNWNVTIRSYPMANHVLRLGDESQSNTPLVDGYFDDLTAWCVGTSLGLRQTSDRIAGATIYQSIPIPSELKADRPLTIYGTILHVMMILLLLASLMLGLVALGRKIRYMIRRRGPALGFLHGFGGSLLALIMMTVAAMLLLVAGFAEVVMRVVRLAWGAAPNDSGGIADWSWPVIQIACVLVVVAWSRLIAHLIEVSQRRGIIRWPPRQGSIRAVVSGHEPVLASTRLARVLFWLNSAAMFSVMLVFAFWGLFLY